MIRGSIDRFKSIYFKKAVEYLIVMAIVWIIVLIYAKNFMDTGSLVHHFTNGVDKTAPSETNFLPLFFWNFAGAAVVIALGVIALPIYWYYVLQNAYSVGLVISIVGSPFLMFVGGVLPHGIFEISAQVIAAAISARLAWYGMNKFLKRKREDIKYIELLKQTLTDTLVLVMPLLFVAAIVETYITPIFIKMIMP